MFKPLITVILLVAYCSAETPTRFRSSVVRSNARFLARQQAAPTPTPTGYPAAGVTPEIPFDLPTSTVKPDVTYLPPDNTYGPPSQPDITYGPPRPHSTYGPPDNTYLPPEDNVTERKVDEGEQTIEGEVEQQQPTAPQPEVQDQPEEQADEPVEEEEGEEILVAVADDGPVIAVSNSFDAQDAQAETKVANVQQPARLVYQRFPQGSRRGSPADVPVPSRLIKMRRTTSAKLQRAQRMQLQPQPQGFSFVSQYTAW